MIGSNIKKLRTEKGMTQKNLADLLFVSAQAVSRWENNEVEPSLETIAKMARIFEVSTDEILGIGVTEKPEPPQPEVVIQKEYVYTAPPKQILAVCDTCKAKIYEPENLYRDTDINRVSCKKCHDEVIERNRQYRIRKSEKRRTLSFWLGSLGTVAALVITAAIGAFSSVPGAFFSILLSISMFTMISCCLFANNFVGEMVVEIFSWGFVRMPGIIFSLDLGGCLFLIVVKILFTLLAVSIMVFFGLLAIVLGGIVSLFVYPYALKKNIQRPEEVEI